MMLTLDNIAEQQEELSVVCPVKQSRTTSSQEVESLQDGGQNGELTLPGNPVNWYRTITGSLVNLDVWKRVFR
jgi:hypothetical protein